MNEQNEWVIELLIFLNEGSSPLQADFFFFALKNFGINFSRN